MKLILLFFLLLLAIHTQTAAQSRFSIKTGITRKTDSKSIGGDDNIEKGLTGLYTGLNVDFWLVRHVSVHSGVELTQIRRVGKQQVGGYHTKYNINYLQLPVDFVGHFIPKKDISILIGTGGFIGWGIFGKKNTMGNKADKIEFDKPGGIHSLDYGADFLTGVRYKQYALTVQRRIGVHDVYIEYNSRDRYHRLTMNDTYLVALNYYLSKSKK